ncbi:hypothetical protein CBF64_07990 [Lactobacillus taiwanensis]|uniref:hypothetical protein n=1 Tax=Lactobacillus taiwanensis TaxID=508451 RepID=UPI000BC86805|nr:hypothetical protein [Lactobacillus taiwanensis]OYR98745.1 hypothetical protein CBF64_07990 [Lactobacillus taiwanensis]
MKKYRLVLTTAALLMAFTLNTGKAKAAENDNNLQDEHNIGLVAETADVRETAPLTANIAGTAATAPTAGTAATAPTAGTAATAPTAGTAATAPTAGTAATAPTAGTGATAPTSSTRYYYVSISVRVYYSYSYSYFDSYSYYRDCNFLNYYYSSMMRPQRVCWYFL